MNPDPLPVIVLRRDPQLGLFIREPEELALNIAGDLEESGVRCVMDNSAAPLAEPGSRVLVLGFQHPLGIQQVLATWEYETLLDVEAWLPGQIYRAPVDKLLSLGEPARDALTVDCAGLGLSQEHVPELIRMTLDEELHDGPGESLIVWAPIHAWRALAALKAEAAIQPLLGILWRLDKNMDDWMASELPDVFAAVGEAALEPAAEYLADTRHGEWARVTAADMLAHIGKAHPELRDRCVAHLSVQLARYAEQEENLNAFLISHLLELGAVEAAPVMECAFKAGKVDEACCGDWEDIQIELGLKSERERPRKPNYLTELGDTLRTLEALKDVDVKREPAGAGYAARPYIAPPKVGRNDPCPCGSARKYKKCCGR